MSISQYRMLGLDPRQHVVSEHQVTKAYRQLALIYHPDKRPHDPRAGQKFCMLQNAYEAVLDDVKRFASQKIRQEKAYFVHDYRKYMPYCRPTTTNKTFSQHNSQPTYWPRFFTNASPTNYSAPRNLNTTKSSGMNNTGKTQPEVFQLQNGVRVMIGENGHYRVPDTYVPHTYIPSSKKSADMRGSFNSHGASGKSTQDVADVGVSNTTASAAANAQPAPIKSKLSALALAFYPRGHSLANGHSWYDASRK